ncbi:MAG: hypothetical protein ACI3Y0_08665 [Prevotella sp.]
MKKYLFLAFALLAFSLNARPQGFFRELGKQLKKSTQTIVTGGSVSSDTKWGKVSITHQIPNMDIELQDVTHTPARVNLTLLFTNKSSRKLQLWDLRSRKIFDSQGNQYASGCAVGKEWLTIGDAYNYFEPGVPTKVVVSIEVSSHSACVISLLKFETSYVHNSKRYETPIEIRNISAPAYTAPAAKAQPAHVFIGQWSKSFHDGNNEISLELYGKWQAHPFDDSRKCIGTITTCINNASRMDEDAITRVIVNGNTAEVEYECGRAFDENGDAQKGKLKLTFNPQTKAVTINMIQTPEGTGECCYIFDGVTLVKVK